LSRQEVEAIDLDEFPSFILVRQQGFLPGPFASSLPGFIAKSIIKDIFISFDPNYRHLLFKNDTQTFIDQVRGIF